MTTHTLNVACAAIGAAALLVIATAAHTPTMDTPVPEAPPATTSTVDAPPVPEVPVLPPVPAIDAPPALPPTPEAVPVPEVPVAPPAPPAAGTPQIELPTYTLPPCASEDSDNCYWNAQRMGNGTGESFVTLNGVTYYAR